MKPLTRVFVLALLAAIITPALARSQMPPEPLPMGTPYIYQIGNPYWYQPIVFYPTYYYSFVNPYPFGSVSPVQGVYTWGYGVYKPAAYTLYPTPVAGYPVSNCCGTYYPHYQAYYYPYVSNYPVPGRIYSGSGW
jgi:hypothetical protein